VDGIPFQDALDGAAVKQQQMGHIMENSLILGNGDLNGLLFSRGETLVLRITKNDVWDARIDTSQDPPLMKVDITGGSWTNTPHPKSWSNPYPCPRVCAEVELGRTSASAQWRQVRAEGRVNGWEFKDDAAEMSIQGRAEASNGYSYGPLDLESDKYVKLRVKLSGSSNAKFYIDVMTPEGQPIFGSKWIASPTNTEEKTFVMPAGRRIGSVILYLWTIDGKPASNRFYDVLFEGNGSKVALDLKSAGRVAPCESVLDLRRAVARVKGSRGDKEQVETAVRAMAQKNVFLIQSTLSARLKPVPASYLPAPETGEQDGVKYVKQQLPADPDWPGMSFVVALAEEGNRKAVAVVTSLDSKDPMSDAARLAKKTLPAEDKKQIAEHEGIWAEFWAASGIEIADPELQAVWYRNLYFMRCVSKPGVEAVGLYAGLTNDNPPWHGGHTLNYNAEQTFWSWYICNHSELSEPYERMIFRYLPRARWFAKYTYDCEGAHIPHNVFAHETFDPEKCKSALNRMHAFSPYAESICVSGWAVQNIWYHYKYYPDKKFLKSTAYPAVRDIALFYANFVEKCNRDESGKAKVGPTYCPEHRGMGEYNCTADLAFMKYIFAAAIEGAMTLKQDEDLVCRFRKAVDVLPSWPVTDEPEPMVTDVLGKAPINYNIAVPALPVFFGDVVTWFSPEEEKRLFRRTLERVQWNGYNSSVIMPVARARLSFPDSVEYMKSEFLKRSRPNGTITLRAGDGCGHFTEQFAAAGAVAELLLQSVGDIIRVFPAWPKDKDAKFVNLRAQGGFLVSAEQKDGNVVKLEIKSTAGGRLQVLNPWTGKVEERETKKGAQVVFAK
jgi:hypothetical protein